MIAAITHFDENIERVKALGGLYEALESLTKGVIDKSDILRSQLVLAVSAFDFYVHELVYLGMLEIFDGQRLPTPAYDRYKISMEVFSTSSFRDAFENEVREKHSYLAFQHPDKIAEAIRHISSIALWDEVANELGLKAKDVKEQLRQIVDRRNKIAHEADIDPSYPGSRWPISYRDVESSVNFLIRVGKAIEIRVG